MQKHSLTLLTSIILCASFGVFNTNAQSSWVKDNNNCRYLKIDASNYKIECNGAIWQDEPDESESSIMMNLNDTAKKIATQNKRKWFQINNFRLRQLIILTITVCQIFCVCILQFRGI